MCRSRRELSSEYLLAKIGVDTAENEPLEVWEKIFNIIHWCPYAQVVWKSTKLVGCARVYAGDLPAFLEVQGAASSHEGLGLLETQSYTALELNASSGATGSIRPFFDAEQRGEGTYYGANGDSGGACEDHRTGGSKVLSTV